MIKKRTRPQPRVRQPSTGVDDPTDKGEASEEAEDKIE